MQGGLPTGTVTFLLTDIEGSTKLWRSHEDVMGRVIARHDYIIAKVVADGGGVFVKSKGEGDSTFSVFTRPGDAVKAALNIQRFLAGEDWPREIQIKVRAAVHTDVAELRAGDYYGTAVNKCARIKSAAHGGQTLCSQTTGDLISDVGVPLRNLGRHRLKDFDRDDVIFQIGDGDFPPIRSLPGLGHRLRAQRTSFIGRGDELAHVGKLLSDGRLVTLTGIGGCGKTRLAIQAAIEHGDAFDDGVFLVELASVSDPDVVYTTVAAAAGVPPASTGMATGRRVRDDLVDFLGDSNTLIVLDNCEHLVDACAELVDDLLTACPGVRVLATSREALEVEGEQTFSVPSLAVPADDRALESESVLLFAHRAGAVRPGFEIGPDNANDVVEICRRLDGLPLGIELAAAQVSHLSPGQIAERLKDRFRLLTGGRRRVQRQQTLGAALDWSYDLLSEAERALLRRLAVFPGSFDLDAAECVGGEGTVVLLRSLVSKSLVTTTETGPDLRYRLLETVRLYAEQRLLDAKEADLYRAKHRDYFMDWAERRSTGPPTLDIAGVFADEEHNIRAALEWSASVGDLVAQARTAAAAMPLWAGGRHDEGARWLDEVLAAADSFDRELKVNVFGAASSVATIRLDGETMYAYGHRCIEAAGDEVSPVVSIAHGNLALYEAFVALTGDVRAIEAARYHGRRAVETAGETQMQRAAALFCRGLALSGAGDFEEAAASLVEAVRTGTGPYDAIGTVMLAASRRAYILHLLGRDHEALESAQQAVTFAEGVPDAHSWLRTGWRLMSDGALALSLAALGRLGDVREWASEIETHLVGPRMPGAMGDLLVAFAGVSAIAGDYERASTLLSAARRDNVTRSPTTVVLYRHYVNVVRANLDETTLRRCRERGAMMSADDAFAFGAGVVG